MTGGKVVIDTTNADGSCSRCCPGSTWRRDSISKLRGHRIPAFISRAARSSRSTLPLHLNLGPVTLPTLYLVAGATTAGIPIEISAALGLTLGPFQASVDRRRGRGSASRSRTMAATWVPPILRSRSNRRAGSALRSMPGVVAGGGFIQFDPAKGQYAGILDVELAGIIQVKIIGILDTKLPDGSHGYSFLLIVTFDLPPIQLGFGFTLNGVGGLFGVNRTMAIDALHAGLRAHTLDSILFPVDPIVNAPPIISNIRSFFPPADGRFVFGPMLEIGWGTPTLITLALGVILEVPDPVRLAIIGLIDAGLPTRRPALISLHIDVLGTIDFGAKKLHDHGSLYDSRVLIYSLSGDLAMRLTWGDDPNFLFSLGGFNPHFNTAGLDIPQLNRMLGQHRRRRQSADQQQQLLCRHIQHPAVRRQHRGVRIGRRDSASTAISGFDVLIVYSPFSFIFDFKASFDVGVRGSHAGCVDVDGTFSGPRPLHLHAHASIDLFFFSVGASLTLEWGDSTPAILPKGPCCRTSYRRSRIRATGVRRCRKARRRRCRSWPPSPTTKRCACIRWGR